MMFWLATIPKSFWGTALIALAGMIFPLFIYFSWTAKVVLTSNSIIKKTPFGVKELKYSEIKSFGVCSQIGRVAVPLSEKNIHKADFFVQKIVYVADRPNYSPNSSEQNGSIVFHLIDDIYEVIKEKLKSQQLTTE